LAIAFFANKKWRLRGRHDLFRVNRSLIFAPGIGTAIGAIGITAHITAGFLPAGKYSQY